MYSPIILSKHEMITGPLPLNMPALTTGFT
jgi:hypothetical protein